MCFNALMGLSCYTTIRPLSKGEFLFQCPHGLELLPCDAYCTDDSGSFNALMGLSCYCKQWHSSSKDCCFNALMGLSCYPWTALQKHVPAAFQCPHGLELLRIL